MSLLYIWYLLLVDVTFSCSIIAQKLNAYNHLLLKKYIY